MSQHGLTAASVPPYLLSQCLPLLLCHDLLQARSSAAALTACQSRSHDNTYSHMTCHMSTAI